MEDLPAVRAAASPTTTMQFPSSHFQHSILSPPFSPSDPVEVELDLTSVSDSTMICLFQIRQARTSTMKTFDLHPQPGA
ncbi:hypothetical protein BJX68DRAFT_225331 [Aspergillus pseudodeflectus]|uniref:Uncharacterized protein n=1 Tax=Aspergillus pseudodeflectus TaxID=176178 RepID=A0ABR4L7T9_9EURO